MAPCVRAPVQQQERERNARKGVWVPTSSPCQRRAGLFAGDEDSLQPVLGLTHVHTVP